MIHTDDYYSTVGIIIHNKHPSPSKHMNQFKIQKNFQNQRD